MHALTKLLRVSKAEVALLQRDLIYSYACLPREELMRMFTTAFLEAPCEALIAGFELAIEAKKESARLTYSDSILASEVSRRWLITARFEVLYAPPSPPTPSDRPQSSHP